MHVHSDGHWNRPEIVVTDEFGNRCDTSHPMVQFIGCPYWLCTAGVAVNKTNVVSIAATIIVSRRTCIVILEHVMFDAIVSLIIVWNCLKIWKVDQKLSRYNAHAYTMTWTCVLRSKRNHRLVKILNKTKSHRDTAQVSISSLWICYGNSLSKMKFTQH